MSACKQRHEQRKVERRRRSLLRHPTSHIKHGVATLTAAAVIAAGTQAYAAPVRFDNPAHGDPGHFEWVPLQAENTKWLDLMEPASAQPAAIDDFTSLRQWNGGWDGSVNGASGGADVEAVDAWGYGLLVGASAGDLIPSGAAWFDQGFVYNRWYGTVLPEGVPTYIGVRFDPGDGLHYGWVGVVREEYLLEAFAWGYESDAGVSVPAGAPEPGTLALLAFGAAALLRRRRA